jgi:integrase
MPSELPKYVVKIAAKGRSYFYFRRGKARFRLEGEPGSPEFEADYRRRLQGIAVDPKPERKVPKSVGALSVDYRSAPEFTSLEPKSQRDYDRDLERLKPIESCKAVDIRRKHIIRLRNKIANASGARAADHFVSVVSALFRCGLDLDYDLQINPAHGIKRLAKSKSFEVWPREVCEAFEKSHPPTYLLTAYQLGRGLGLRASDIVRVGPAHREGDTIVIRCRKTQKSSGVDAHASMSIELRTYLETLPKGLLYVRLDDGSSLDANTLAKRMRSHLDGLGITGYSVHGLRHMRGMELAEAGCSELEIMVQLGHVTPQMAAHYTKAARRKWLATSAATKLEAARRTIVKLKV